jgi:Holliday junction resolvase RusA-like endonuclease
MTGGPVTIVFAGPPQAQARARFGNGHVYTAPATRDFQHDFGWCAKAAMAGRRPFQSAVRITALFELPVPASWSQRKRADAIAGVIRPTARPDLDNFLKAAFDASNGIVFADDAQITEISAKKVFGVNPKTVFTIAQASNGKAP